MQAVAYIQRGNGKKSCEDSALVGKQVFTEAGGPAVFLEYPFMLSLADGVGGYLGGGDASLFLMEKLAGWDLAKMGTELRVKEKLLQINKELLALAAGSNGKEQMASTLTGVIVRPGRCLVFHVGNTRIYAIANGHLQQLSTDHTPAQLLRMQGEFDAAEKAAKNEILGCMGGGDASFADLLQVFVTTAKVDGFMLTSDGLHDHLLNRDLEQMLRTDNPAKCFDSLCEKAYKAGSMDDKSLLLFEKP